MERDKVLLKVAYIMSRFPKLTETFILYEMLAVEQQGVSIELYPLLRERTEVMHPESVELVERANFTPFISWPILKANIRYAVLKPGLYLSTLYRLIAGNVGSLRFLSRAIAIFPKSVYFAHEMQREKVDHIHAHFASHPAAAAYAVHRLTGIPYSFTAHGSDIHRDRTMLDEKVEHSAFVVPISAYNRQVILDACDGAFAEKMKVIHCGVDTEVFHPSIVKGEAENSMPLSILCIGTLHEVKGQRFLIEACRLLDRKGIPFICRFIGDGPDRKALERQADQAGLAGCVEFLGTKTRDEIAQMLQSVDILAAPSVPSQDGRREGIPVVLMEAMASGVAVVASCLSGIPELVVDGKDGLLVPPGDAAALADTMEKLAKDPVLRKRLGLDARKKVEREFDVRTNASHLIRLFSQGVEA